MAGNRIDAMLRFAADFKEVRAGIAEIKRDLASLSGTKVPIAGDPAQAAAAQEQLASTRAISAEQAQAAAAAKRAKTDERAAARQAAAEQAAALKAQRAAERQAETERKAAQKDARLERLRQAQLAPQVTDIVTGLAGGQNPLLVAIQQGGQLSDIYGGLANAGRALLTVFTPLRIVLGGVAAAIGLVGLAAYKGAAEQTEFNRALAVTGNTAATSYGEVGRIAQDIATRQRAAIGSVRETVMGLATSGQYTSTTLATAARASSIFQRATGQSADEAQKHFADMQSGVSAWAAKTNQAYNFLTAAEYRRIQALEASGKKDEAARMALDAFATSLEQRVLPNLGLLERAWIGVGNAVSGAWEALKNIGRDDAPEQLLEKLRKRYDDLKKAKDGSRYSGVQQGALDELGVQIAAIERQINMDKLRREERARNQAEENEKIKESQKSFQNALASLSAAEAQRALAQRQAQLDQEAAQVELAYAKGLTSAEDHALALNAIEQKRLQAQAANVKRQIEIESGRAVDPANAKEDGLARDARVVALQGQLAQVNGQIAAAATKAQTITEGAALDQAREQAKAWADIWLKAEAQLRALSESVPGDAVSPLELANAQADKQVAALKERLIELKQGLTLLIRPELSPGQLAEVQRQLQALEERGAKALDAAKRSAVFDSLKAQYSALTDSLSAAEAEVDAQLQAGVLSTEEAERRKFDARDKALPQLREIAALMAQVASAPGDAAALARLNVELVSLADRTTELQRSLASGVGSAGTELFKDWVKGAKSARAAFDDFIDGVGRTVLNIVAQRYGEQLARSMLPDVGGASASSGGSLASWLGRGVSALVGLFHSGGVVGDSVHSMTRAVSPAIFGAATRYHSGGIAGLAADEVPAVLRKGEEVLTASDPRHRANGGMTGGQMVFNTTIDLGGGAAVSSRADGQRLSDGMRAAMQSYLINEMRPGGLLAKGS